MWPCHYGHFFSLLLNRLRNIQKANFVFLWLTIMLNGELFFIFYDEPKCGTRGGKSARKINFSKWNGSSIMQLMDWSQQCYSILILTVPSFFVSFDFYPILFSFRVVFVVHLRCASSSCLDSFFSLNIHWLLSKCYDTTIVNSFLKFIILNYKKEKES